MAKDDWDSSEPSELAMFTERPMRSAPWWHEKFAWPAPRACSCPSSALNAWLGASPRSSSFRARKRNRARARGAHFHRVFRRM